MTDEVRMSYLCGQLGLHMGPKKLNSLLKFQAFLLRWSGPRIPSWRQIWGRQERGAEQAYDVLNLPCLPCSGTGRERG